jgi:hypothetical protein
MGIEDRQQTREIDGVTYIVNPLPFGVGKKALLRFTRVAGGALGGLEAGGDKAKMMLSLVAAISTALSDEDVDYFAKIFGDASWYVDGQKNVPLLTVNHERHFELRYTAFFEWLAFCVEVNFSPFFSGLLNRLGVAIPTVATPSISLAKTG